MNRTADALVRTEGITCAYDGEPALVNVDIAIHPDDFVGIVLDTFNDERRAFEFFVNPLGVQMDMFIDDVSNNEDPSWDALWWTAGRISPFAIDSGTFQ